MPDSVRHHRLGTRSLAGWVGSAGLLLVLGLASPLVPPAQAVVHRAHATATAQARMSADVRTDTFAISGMFCADCARRITAQVRKTPGVKAVSVDYETGKGTITYEAGKVNVPQLIRAIQKAGYRAKST